MMDGRNPFRTTLTNPGMVIFLQIPTMVSYGFKVVRTDSNPSTVWTHRNRQAYLEINRSISAFNKRWPEPETLEANATKGASKMCPAKLK